MSASPVYWRVKQSRTERRSVRHSSESDTFKIYWQFHCIMKLSIDGKTLRGVAK